MPRREPELLFQEGDLRGTLENMRDRMIGEIKGADEEYLLNTDLEQWVAYLVAEYEVDLPVLHADRMEIEDHGPTDVDVSHQHFSRAISDPSRPAYVAGRSVSIIIPFTGDPLAFRLRAGQYSLNPPRAVLGSDELRLPVEYPTDTTRPDLKSMADELVRKVTQALSWSEADVKPHNERLASEARRAIELRRKRVLEDHAHLDDIGIPVRQRGDAPTTYQAPSVRRKDRPKPRPKEQPGKPARPEPTMVAAFYDHILEVTRAWVRAMERTPGDYADASEEKLRDALLIMLNTHYEGQGQAEAFNKSGKTDILVRVEDRNIFIAECKVWKGPKSAVAALEQLFGYTTWRDTKLALIFFVHQLDIATVTEKAKTALASSEAVGSWQSESSEGELRCDVAWPEDPQRRGDLTVFFVHLPASEA